MAHGDITHLDIPVTDLAAAKEFYGGLFGWQIEAPPGFEEYPMWRAPNQISGGGLAQRTEGFTQPRSYVEVDSIDDTLAPGHLARCDGRPGQGRDLADQLVGGARRRRRQPHRALRGHHRDLTRGALDPRPGRGISVRP